MPLFAARTAMGVHPAVVHTSIVGRSEGAVARVVAPSSTDAGRRRRYPSTGAAAHPAAVHSIRWR